MRLVAVVQAAAKKVPLAAAPAHVEGRRIASEIERVGLRLQWQKAQAEVGDIVLLFYGHDSESEVLTHPYLARVGRARRGPVRSSPGAAQVEARTVTKPVVLVLDNGPHPCQRAAGEPLLGGEAASALLDQGMAKRLTLPWYIW